MFNPSDFDIENVNFDAQYAVFDDGELEYSVCIGPLRRPRRRGTMVLGPIRARARA